MYQSTRNRTIGGGLDSYMMAVVTDRQQRASRYDVDLRQREARRMEATETKSTEIAGSRHRRRHLWQAGRRTKPATESI